MTDDGLNDQPCHRSGDPEDRDPVDVGPKGLENTITSPGSSVRFEASCSKQATLSLFKNSIPVKTVTGTSLSQTITFPGPGDNWIKMTATSGQETAEDSVFVGVTGSQDVVPLPEGMKDGINYTAPDSVCLVLYAPGKDNVFLMGDFNGWIPYGAYRANRDGDRFWLAFGSLTPGQEYAYQYLVDGKLNIADPYTEKVLDPVNDRWIPDSVYPNLKPYPYGLTTGIVSVLQTDQQPYHWSDTSYMPPTAKDLIIYELLLRDFLAAHDWKTLTDTLDYFTRLGINAIEVMPFNEFEGNESWGYNPSFYFAPDKYYGPEHDLKAFVDSCHHRGIAIIQDMVLNHSYGQSPLVQLYFDSATNRPSADNPWYNQTSPNPVFSFGYDFNQESPATKAFIDRVNRHWMQKYHIDGYRFDFTKGFTNTPGDGYAYDASRIAILKRMADSIWAVKPGQYVILEHFTANTEEIVLSNTGMMLWGNENCQYNQCTMGYPTGPCTWDISGVAYTTREWSNPRLVAYMESHDEERLMYKNLTYGNSSGSYDIRQLSTALRRVEEAAAFFFTVPGPKMLWQFEEMGYDYSIDFNGRVGNKPIRWDYLHSRNRVFQVFRSLIGLRSEEAVFDTRDFSLDVSGAFKRIELNSPDMNVRIIGNFDVVTQQGDPAFSRGGTWYDFFTGDSVQVGDPHALVDLEPGEYHIYTTRALHTPDLPTKANPGKTPATGVTVYPVPATSRITVASPLPMKEITLFDLSLRPLARFDPAGMKYTLDVSGLAPGVYILRIVSVSGEVCVSKIIRAGN